MKFSQLAQFASVEARSFLARRRAANRDAVVAMQNRRLRRLLTFAARRSPFYQRYYSAAGIDPQQITDAQQLDLLPLIGREDFAELGLHMLSGELDAAKCHVFTTSGTTGRPLEVVKPHGEWLNDLVRSRTRLRHLGVGIRHFRPLGCAMLYVSDTEYRPEYRQFTQRLPAFNLGYYRKIDIRAEFHPDPLDPIRIIAASAPVVMVGKPSSLRALAALAARKEARAFRIRPRIIMTGAEQLVGNARADLEAAFACPVFDSYGLTETGLIGCECPERNGLHVEDDYMIVEIVRNGRRVDPGEEGEIVATNLTNLLQPLIRYRTGDVGRVTYEECPCGSAYPRIMLIEGRVVDFFVTEGGAEINPFLLLGKLPKLGLKQYQLVQRTPCDILVRYVGEAAPALVAAAIRAPVGQYMGKGVRIGAERVETLDVPGRKTRLYVNDCRPKAG